MPGPAVSRRHFTRLVAAQMLGASGVAVPALALDSKSDRADKADKGRVTIAVGGKASLYYLPLTVAEQLGHFKAEGLQVEITDFSGGSRALHAVMAGTADVVSGAYEHTIHLQSRGQLYQAFVLQGRAPQIALGVSTRTMPGYRGWDDLRGKRIGVTAPGSSTNMMVNLLLARAGIRAADVSFVGVGPSAGALAAVRSGQVDALCNIDPVMTMLEQKGELRIISDTRTLKGTLEVFGGPMPAACLYAPLEFVQKQPHTAQALTHAIVHALKWLQTASSNDIVKTVPEAYLLGYPATYLASFHKIREALSLDGLIPDEGARTALRALSSFEAGVRADRIDLSRTYTNQFARRAKERFKA